MNASSVLCVPGCATASDNLVALVVREAHPTQSSLPVVAAGELAVDQRPHGLRYRFVIKSGSPRPFLDLIEPVRRLDRDQSRGNGYAQPPEHSRNTAGHKPETQNMRYSNSPQDPRTTRTFGCSHHETDIRAGNRSNYVHFQCTYLPRGCDHEHSYLSPHFTTLGNATLRTGCDTPTPRPGQDLSYPMQSD